MGFRKIHEINIAMLGKQGWRLLTSPYSLVARVLKERYYLRGSFLDASIGHNPSFSWRTILASQFLIKRGVKWRIEDGSKVKVFADPWLSDDDPFIHTPIIEGMESIMVSSLMFNDQVDWDANLLRDIFSTRGVNLIQGIPLSLRRQEDVLTWR